MKARVIPPPGVVTGNGEVFADHAVPGPVAGVPVTVGFDSRRVIGFATVFPNGTADIQIDPKSEEYEQVRRASCERFTIGYQVIRSHKEGDQTVYDEIRPLSVGLEIERKP